MGLVPSGPLTLTSTVPAGPAGEIAVIELSELTVKPSTSVVPNSTAVVPMKPAPRIITVVPPPTGPLVGDTSSKAGRYRNWSTELVPLVPSGVVTVTSTVPLPGGDLATMLVADCSVKVTASTEPNLTEPAPRKWAPVIATEVPPVRGPSLGFTPATIGVFADSACTTAVRAEVAGAEAPPALDAVTATRTVELTSVAVRRYDWALAPEISAHASPAALQRSHR